MMGVWNLCSLVDETYCCSLNVQYVMVQLKMKEPRIAVKSFTYSRAREFILTHCKSCYETRVNDEIITILIRPPVAAFCAWESNSAHYGSL